MDFTFIMDDKEAGTSLTMKKGGVEFLGDLAEAFLQFTIASGYTYVNKVTIHKDSGETVETF